MIFKRLGDICKLRNGRAFKPEEWSDQGLPIIRIQNLNDLTKSFNYCNLDIDEKFVVDTDDLLFSWSGTPGTSFGAFIWNRGKGYLNQHIFRVDVDNRVVDRKYLKYALNSQLSNIISQAHGGVGLQHITKAKLDEIPILLPPLEEQHRIASILDKADEIRQKRQQAIAKLNELLQATFIDMFGDPVSNPKGFKLQKLSEIGVISTGNTPSRADEDNYGNFIEWIKSDNLNNDFDIATQATEYLSEKGKQKGRIVPAGSILVTCIAGSLNCIGNLAIVDREVAFNQQINAVTPKENIQTEYLYYLLKVSKSIIQSFSTNAMKGMISKSTFSQIELPIASSEQQAKFVEIFNKFSDLKSNSNKELSELDNLFKALQQKAFSGTL